MNDVRKSILLNQRCLAAIERIRQFYGLWGISQAIREAIIRHDIDITSKGKDNDQQQ